MRASSSVRYIYYALPFVFTAVLSACSGNGSGVVPSGTTQQGPAASGPQAVVKNATASTPALVQHRNGSVFAPTTITVRFTSVPTSGDTLIVFFHNHGATSGAPITYTAPTGWTRIDVDTAHVLQSYSAYYHIAGTSESNTYAFTPSCACREHVWTALEFSGVNTTAPIDKHGFQFINQTTSFITLSETPTQAGDLAVVAMLPTTSGLTWTNTTGWSVDSPTSPTQLVWSTEVLQKLDTTSAAMSESSTLSASSVGYAAILLLNPGNAAAPPAKADWPTWGMKPTRNSYNPVETTLTVGNVGGLHQIWSHPLSGVITDAPVVAANVTGTSQGTADVLYVGDAHADFVALNANTGTQLWSTTKLTTTVSTSSGCDDQPAGLYGVGGSATIDRTSSRVYFVDGPGNLYGLDLATGSQKVGPVAMWPFQNGTNITNDYGGLNESSAAGLIYVPASAHCGLANYGGVETYNIATGAVSHFYTEGGPPNTFGGVWGPGGAVIDPRNVTTSSMNNIYFGTAFGPLGTNKHSYSVVRLTSTLGLVAANNPVTTTCCPDLDFGDTPLVITPSSSGGCTSTLAIAESKNAKLYVYNADAINSGPIQTVQLGSSDENGQNVGTAAYDPTRNLVYIPNGSDSSSTTTGLKHGLVAFTVTAACQLSLVWQVTVGPNQVHDGPPAPPTVANGVVFYADGPGSGTCSPVGPSGCAPTADFYAFNATSGAQLLHVSLPGALFTAPVVVNGKVYLTAWTGSGTGMVYGFGL